MDASFVFSVEKLDPPNVYRVTNIEEFGEVLNYCVQNEIPYPSSFFNYLEQNSEIVFDTYEGLESLLSTIYCIEKSHLNGIKKSKYYNYQAVLSAIKTDSVEILKLVMNQFFERNIYEFFDEALKLKSLNIIKFLMNNYEISDTFSICFCASVSELNDEDLNDEDLKYEDNYLTRMANMFKKYLNHVDCLFVCVHHNLPKLLNFFIKNFKYSSNEILNAVLDLCKNSNLNESSLILLDFLNQDQIKQLAIASNLSLSSDKTLKLLIPKYRFLLTDEDFIKSTYVNIKSLEFLVEEYNLNIHMYNEYLFIASIVSENFQIFKYLLNKGADYNYNDGIPYEIATTLNFSVSFPFFIERKAKKSLVSVLPIINSFKSDFDRLAQEKFTFVENLQYYKVYKKAASYLEEQNFEKLKKLIPKGIFLYDKGIEYYKYGFTFKDENYPFNNYEFLIQNGANVNDFLEIFCEEDKYTPTDVKFALDNGGYPVLKYILTITRKIQNTGKLSKNLKEKLKLLLSY